MRSEPEKVWTVAGLTATIKSNLESSYPSVFVEGEISNLKAATSGHLYFSLKDRDAMIQAVMFRYRSRELGFEPSDGLKVVARGGVTVYAPRGQYQMLVESMRRSGEGDILAMLEERKRRLAAEGLFDDSRKRRLPRIPECIGVITSPTGAAVRDILSVLGRRNPGVRILVMPTPVQGGDAPAKIVARIVQANRHKLADLLIVGRGGGSLEDLLAFSDESVVRAIAESSIPIVSAVGHEVDWALSDYAADLRAPTPSAAAELVCPSREALAGEIAQFSMAIGTAMKARVDYASMAAARFEPADVESRFMRLFLPVARRHDDARERLGRAVSDRLRLSGHQIDLAERNLSVASPQAVMERGYAVVRKVADLSRGKGDRGSPAIRDAASLKEHDLLDIRFARGGVGAEVRGPRP